MRRSSRRLWGHMLDPRHSMHWLLQRLCSHICAPPHSLHWLLSRLWGQMLDPSHSLPLLLMLLVGRGSRASCFHKSPPLGLKLDVPGFAMCIGQHVPTRTSFAHLPAYISLTLLCAKAIAPPIHPAGAIGEAKNPLPVPSPIDPFSLVEVAGQSKSLATGAPSSPVTPIPRVDRTSSKVTC